MARTYQFLNSLNTLVRRDDGSGSVIFEWDPRAGGRCLTGKNRIMIYGPKNDGTYVVEFRTAAGEALAIYASRGAR